MEDIQIQKQQTDQIMKTAHQTAEKDKEFNVLTGIIVFVLLISKIDESTLKAGLIFLILQVILHKLRVCGNVYAVSYCLVSMEDRMEYMHLVQFSRTTLKLSVYLMLTGVYAFLYVVTRNPYVWFGMKLCMAIPTIFI